MAGAVAALAGAAAAVTAWCRGRNERDRPDDNGRSTSTTTGGPAPHNTRDEVDTWGEDSFPASDPPPTTPGRPS